MSSFFALAENAGVAEMSKQMDESFIAAQSRMITTAGWIHVPGQSLEPAGDR